ncbi:hypothetical protein L3X40_20175 [Rhizorhapis sp. SPR117]|nr:hypothetical protein [Rhizorhapis sp. SPR117]
MIASLLCAGCNSPASQTADAPNAASGYAARERELIEMCNEIAIEREVLVAKYNAMIEVHKLNMRPEPLTVQRCS